MSALFFRHAFSDYHSLREVEQGCLPGVRDLRRRLFVLERRLDSRRPDHFYHSYLENRFAPANSVAGVVTVVLRGMSERFLEVRPGGVYVRAEAFGDWQSAVGLLSPLALATYAIGAAADRVTSSSVEEVVRGRVGTTACRGPLVPSLEDLIATDGLYDLHMHLNGSTEVDLIWEDATRHPDVYRTDFTAPFEDHESIRELYDQIEDGLTISLVHRRLRAARRARHLVARALRDAEAGVPPARLGVGAVLAAIALETEDADVNLPGVSLSDHPFETLTGLTSDLTPLEREAAFLLSCFDGMARLTNAAEAIGLMLWHNFTVFSQLARLAVHQFDQSGFHQFNKTVQSGVRETIERSYKARFEQLNGRSAGGDLAYVDGRFAPKDSPAKTAEILESVIDGLLDYRACPDRRRGRNLHGTPPACLSGPCACPGRRDRLDLALVAHFIKRPAPATERRDGYDTGPPARHLALRARLAGQQRALRSVMDQSQVARSLIRGVDGAGNELDAPPEVFAPTFRSLRLGSLVAGATFHVGEDFLHLASGVRAVEEAVRYLDLGAGDRVGHAIALGVEPAFWIERVADRVLVPAEDVLDDAVYTLQALRARGVTTGDEGRLAGRVESLSRDLYGQVETASDLERAWALRGLDVAEVIELERMPGGVVSEEGGFVRHVLRAADESLDDRRASERRLIAAAAETDPVAFRLFRRRHNPDFLRRGRVTVEVVVSSRGARPEYSIETLCALQAHGIQVLNAAQVVIEAMPTSNVRINAYRSFDEHHLARWLGLSGTPLPARPLVCLGSDDPGIFTTNARNEYAHIYLALAKRTSAAQAMGTLRDINATGRSHRFAPRPRRA